MAKRYRPVRRDQPFLFPPDMREWLAEDHSVWLVITAVEDHMDTRAFHAGRNSGRAGTAGYDPDMLVTVLVWAYAHQVTSSRRIEQLCQTDVAFKVICGGNTPRHVTISEFRAAFPGMIGGVFAEVLALCARLGMGRLGVVALDGMKIAASASQSANPTQEQLSRPAAETLARHGETDEAEDDLFGPGARGDEVPADAWSPRRRDQRMPAALAGLRAGRQGAQAERGGESQAYLQAAAAGQAPPGAVPADAAGAAARLRPGRAEAAQRAKVAAWQQRRAEEGAARGRRRARRAAPAPPAGACSGAQGPDVPREDPSP